MIDNNCYYLKKYEFNDSLFKKVEATYIIHLSGNGRLESIEEQLISYHPTAIVYILFNKGFKKCEKEKYIDKPPLDLIDAFYTCFKDANKKNYENILILEDDFIFDKKIVEKKNTTIIDSFLDEKNKKKELFVYYLGAIPYLQSALGNYHNNLLLSVGTHSCIYPKDFIQYLLNKINKENIKDWDFYLNSNFKRYIFYTSLCYQTLPETENSKYWDRNNIFLKYLFKIFRQFQLIIHLNKNPQPGFKIMEIASKILFWFIIISIIFIIISIYTIFNKKILKKNSKNNTFYYYILYFFIFIFILYPIILMIFLLFTIFFLSLIYY